MYCVKCGNKLNDSDIFCQKCGSKIPASEVNMVKRNARRETSFIIDTFISHKMDLKRQNKLMYGIVLLSFVECLFLMVSIISAIVAPPIGIAMLVGCFFFLMLIIKQGKKCAEVGRRIKSYKSSHRQTLNIMGDTTYCFIAPFDTNETMAKITEVLSKIGIVTNVDSLHCLVSGKIQVDLKKMQQIIFYIENNEKTCKVRAVFKKVANDGWWDYFLQELFASSPGVDYGVSIANGNPQLAAVLHLGDDTRQVSFSKTTGGSSLGGFLVGGFLFGAAGAVVGGLSGKQRTITHTNTVYSNTLPVRIIYSNGRLWEGAVCKNSNLYNQIMVNM